MIQNLDPKIDDAKRLLGEICAAQAEHDSEIMQGVEGERRHALDVLSWVTRFDPNASLALGIAALFHDIDRIINPAKGGGFKGDRNSSAYFAHKKQHARRSAVFTYRLLIDNGFPNRVAERAKYLILHHDHTGDEVERIGDAELDQLVAADSFAFFSSIAPKLYAAEGLERIADKIRFMVDKLPESARKALWELRLDSDVFEVIKNDVIREYYLRHSLAEKPYKYCPSCRVKLARKLVLEVPYLSCPKCGFIFWNHPSPVTSVIIERGEEVLLLKRAAAPLQGYWRLPGGFIHYAEPPQDAAIREVKEETNLAIRTRDLLGVYQIDNDPSGVCIDIVWIGSVNGGKLRTDEESTEARYFNRDDLPSKIAYKHRQAILDSDRRRR